jgi:UDP-glucose:glycoprotein glucosyltransferase
MPMMLPYVHSEEDTNHDHHVTITYSVKSLLVYGQCLDMTESNHVTPPNGLQLLLAPQGGGPPQTKPNDVVQRRPVYDTVVMKNLGYFQLQATPGVWHLALAPGRASDVFDIHDMSTRPSSPV